MERDGICKACWSNKDCNPETSGCCVAQLYRQKQAVTEEETIKWCCIERCQHSKSYHNERCPIKLSGINDKYPLNPCHNPSEHIAIISEGIRSPLISFEPVPESQRTLSEFVNGNE